MTDQEIAQALVTLIREDAKRPPLEQVRALIEAGVIDEQGRVLVGFWNKTELEQKPPQQNGPGKAISPREATES